MKSQHIDDSLDFMQGMRSRVKGARREVSDEVCAEYYERRKREFREEYKNVLEDVMNDFYDRCERPYYKYCGESLRGELEEHLKAAKEGLCVKGMDEATLEGYVRKERGSYVLDEVKVARHLYLCRKELSEQKVALFFTAWHLVLFMQIELERLRVTSSEEIVRMGFNPRALLNLAKRVERFASDLERARRCWDELIERHEEWSYKVFDGITGGFRRTFKTEEFGRRFAIFVIGRMKERGIYDRGTAKEMAEAMGVERLKVGTVVNYMSLYHTDFPGMGQERYERMMRVISQ